MVDRMTPIPSTKRPSVSTRYGIAVAQTPKLILATRSPSRAAQLAAAGFDFERVDPRYRDPEQPGQSLAPELEARALAGRKAISVYELTVNGNVILSADTIVITASNTHLGKPANADEARSMLDELIANPHRIVTGIAIMVSDKLLFAHEEAVVTITPPSSEAVDRFIESGAWQGAAVAYRVDDVRETGWSITSSVDPVGGLPIELVTRMLSEVGVDPDG